MPTEILWHSTKRSVVVCVRDRERERVCVQYFCWHGYTHTHILCTLQREAFLCVRERETERERESVCGFVRVIMSMNLESNMT